MNKIDKSNYIIEGTFNEQADSCLICLEPLTFPVRCISCKSNFCKKCAEKWNTKHHICPKKCGTKNWQFEEFKSNGILLRCPFQNKNCKNMSPQEFQQHNKVCQLAPAQKLTKSDQEKKKQYLCKNQHKLEFMSLDKRYEIQNSNCAQCEQNNIARSFCKQCLDLEGESSYYCCLCRSPPINRICCPLNHKFKIKKSGLMFTTCDYCLKNVRQAGTQCYNDEQCDYAICLNCYYKLPEEKNPVQYQVEQHPYFSFSISSLSHQNNSQQ